MLLGASIACHLKTQAGADGASTTDGNSNGGAAAAQQQQQAKRTKFAKLGKDPNVDTTFLLDKDREMVEEEMKLQLRKVRPASAWQPQQDP